MTTFDFSVVSGDPTVIGDSVKYAITSTFSKGKIKLGEVEIARTGNVSSFTYTGGTLAGTTAYTDAGGLSATQLKELIVTAGASAVTYSAKADYSQGPQPLDSKGNAYDSPLPASSSAALTFTTPVASRWKWQATSGQSSVDMVQQVPADKATMPSDVDGKYLELTWAKQMVVGESRQLQIPAIWGGIKGIKVRDFAGNWVWLYGYATAYQDQYASSQVVVNIGGTNYTYDKLVADSSLKLAADLFRVYLN
jgi:hypothetical protein